MPKLFQKAKLQFFKILKNLYGLMQIQLEIPFIRTVAFKKKQVSKLTKLFLKVKH